MDIDLILDILKGIKYLIPLCAVIAFVRRFIIKQIEKSKPETNFSGEDTKYLYMSRELNFNLEPYSNKHIIKTLQMWSKNHYLIYRKFITGLLLALSLGHFANIDFSKDSLLDWFAFGYAFFYIVFFVIKLVKRIIQVVKIKIKKPILSLNFSENELVVSTVNDIGHSIRKTIPYDKFIEIREFKEGYIVMYHNSERLNKREHINLCKHTLGNEYGISNFNNLFSSKIKERFMNFENIATKRFNTYANISIISAIIAFLASQNYYSALFASIFSIVYGLRAFISTRVIYKATIGLSAGLYFFITLINLYS